MLPLFQHRDDPIQHDREQHLRLRNDLFSRKGSHPRRGCPSASTLSASETPLTPASLNPLPVDLQVMHEEVAARPGSTCRLLHAQYLVVHAEPSWFPPALF